jgi:hypothetical protein
LIILTSVPIFISCGDKEPIPEKDFIKIYAYMTIMQDTSQLTQSQIREKILSEFRYSESDYYKTINLYNSSPEKWTIFFDKVIEYVEGLISKTKKIEPLTLPKRYVLKDM